MPLLLALLDDGDPRARAQAARALAAFADRAEVVERLGRVKDDPCWPVRAGAYESLSLAEPRLAIPLLVQAVLREEGEMAWRVDRHLERLTGCTFEHKTSAWGGWYEEAAPSIEDETFRRRGRGDDAWEETRTVASFFRVPLVSRRVTFAIDFSESMEYVYLHNDEATNRVWRELRLPHSRLGSAVAELVRALRGMDDGVLFNVVAFADDARSLAPQLQHLNDATRQATVTWATQLEQGVATDVYGALRACFQDYWDGSTGAGRFADLPDTLVLLTDGHATSGLVKDLASLRRILRLWNEPVGMAVHGVGIGATHDAALLGALADDTWGMYVHLFEPSKSAKRKRR